MVSMVELSEVFLIVMLPLSRSTASLKVSTTSALSETPVALSVGEEEERVGLATSAVVKLALAALIALLEASSTLVPIAI